MAANTKGAKAPAANPVPPEENGTDASAHVDLVAIEPIRHDGADIAPGETFSASLADAAALRISGAVRLATRR